MGDRLFGTDGIRGLAGEFPLDSATVFHFGKALARLLQRETGRTPRIVIGRDTRESGVWLEQAVAAGVAAEGGEVESAGVATTPGVAFFASRFGFDVGVVISASHNPYQDNGLKVFTPSGRKLDDVFEREIEAELQIRPTIPPPAINLAPSSKYNEQYLRFLAGEVSQDLDLFGSKIILDCANGASAVVAPNLFTALGADITAIGAEPNGHNINEGCGSLYPELLQETVRRSGAQLGIAFDGDADRALFVDQTGTLRDGDYVLYILGRHFKENGELAGNRVVATVMSNLGLELGLKELGIELRRVAVGDKYVLEELLSTDSSLGGEQSGHIIFPRLSLAGDGLITALLLLRTLAATGKSLSELSSGMQKYPQILVNVKVGRKPAFESVPEIQQAADQLKRSLDGHGRLLLRYSGTENLARVMIEGKNEAEITKQAHHLADIIKAALA